MFSSQYKDSPVSVFSYRDIIRTILLQLLIDPAGFVIFLCPYRFVEAVELNFLIFLAIV